MSTTPSHFRRLASSEIVSGAASAFVIVCGLIVLAGWQFDRATLTSVFPGLPRMMANTALAFILAGTALWLSRQEPVRRRRRLLAQACSAVVVLIALLTLGEHVFGWDFGIDQLFVADRSGTTAGRPVFQTALTLALLGLALGLLDVQPRRGPQPTQVLTVLAVLVGLLALIGYACSVPTFYGSTSAAPKAGISLLTAVSAVLLGVGVLCARPDRGLAAVLFSKSSGGAVARRLLLGPVLIPLVVGWLGRAAQRGGLYGPELGNWLFSFSNIVVFTLVIWWSASLVHRSDTERVRAEDTIRLYADIVKNTPAGLILYRLERPDDWKSLRLVTANPAASALLGIPLDGYFGKAILDIFPNVTDAIGQPFLEAVQTGRAVELGETRYGDAQVAERWWAVRAFPLPGQCVGVSFEDVSERKRAEDTIRELNADLETRVRRRTAELADANRDLDHKNQENELFVYSVSHDLRSPLVNLQGFSKELGAACQELRTLLTGEGVPPAARARALEIVDGDMAESLRFILNGVMRLSGIIDALLRLSRVGRVEYQWRMVDLANLARRIVESMRATTDERGATVTVGALPAAWGDLTGLEQVFANLIGNALNYLDPNRRGLVEIGSTNADLSAAGMTYYFVRDNGLGIPEVYQHKIFQAFQRVHPEIARGEGMGLAIVRRVVERHGGKVWVESQPGVGSTFFVALPNPPANSVSKTGPISPERMVAAQGS